MIIFKEFTFDSAHRLPNYSGKCSQLHGHTYKLQVGIKGRPSKETGMVVDFVWLSQLVKDKVIEKYDHKLLNEFWKNPTAEVMAADILRQLKKAGGEQIDVVRLWETPTSYVEVTTADVAERI